MRKRAIIKAQFEARRFLDCIKPTLDQFENDWQLGSGTKETAALKRASMDLTRALAELRRP